MALVQFSDGFSLKMIIFFIKLYLVFMTFCREWLLHYVLGVKWPLMCIKIQYKAFSMF